MVKIQLKGLNEVFSNINRATSKVLKDVDKSIEMGGIMIETDAKKLAPVDTGTLRRKIISKHTLLKSVVRSDAEYSVYVNFGTRKQKANPYFTNAINLNQKKILNNIKKALQNI